SVASAGRLGGLICYLIVETRVFFIVTSLGEMAAYLALPGAFTTFGMAKLPGRGHAVNAILLSSVLSAGQLAYYASTRTLTAMGREGKLSAIFGRVNSCCVPLYPSTLVTLVACVAFVTDAVDTRVMFTWLVNLTGMSALLTWLSVSVVHLRFRTAYKAQGGSIKDLPYVAPFFPYSCYISIVLALMIAFVEGYQAVTADPFVVEDVMAVFAGAPVFFFFSQSLDGRFTTRSRLSRCWKSISTRGRPTIVQGIAADGGGV
ncbi:hypothetical protein BGZ47_004038, partial [Haplosporangium gracile]